MVPQGLMQSQHSQFVPTLQLLVIVLGNEVSESLTYSGRLCANSQHAVCRFSNGKDFRPHHKKQNRRMLERANGPVLLSAPSTYQKLCVHNAKQM